MGYVRKTKDEWVIMSNNGYGWEDIVHYDSYKEAREDLKAYIENDKTASYKLVKKRVQKEA